MARKLFLGTLLVLLLAALPAAGSDPEGPAHSATAGLTQAQVVAALQSGALTLTEARQLGLLVFSTPFNTYDGMGDGPWDPAEVNTRIFGHRPTLQGNGLSLRINGLDAQSCNECHTIVSNRTLPPTTGLAGVGGIVQNAIIMPSLIDVADSFDDRVSYVAGHTPDLPLVWDGDADYNGRFANPPFLFGGGGTELLGKEMTLALQHKLRQAQLAPAGTVISLDTHGVNFGHITSLGGGNVDIQAEGVNDDLVVRPFGRKGENFSMRDFDRGAMQFHFGIQPVEVVGADLDEDGDGTVNEVTVAEMSLLHVFDVANPVPRFVPFDNTANTGKLVFQKIGCTNCHKPMLRTRGRWVPVANPEVPNDPTANVYYAVNLVHLGFQPDPNGDGVLVPFFADLKRHYMGEGLREDFEFGEISNGEFTTARLWGVADTAPYLHDGRATTLYQAISMHGGEAQGPRDTFVSLPQQYQNALISFLKSLRVPERPNEDLLPLQ